MNDLVDIFYRDVRKGIEEYSQSVIQKSFVNKSGEIELIPINIAKGEIKASKQLLAMVDDLYNKYKANLNNM